MSTIEKMNFNASSASKYNTKVSKKIGWEGCLPEAVVEKEPLLRHTSSTPEFAKGVYRIQQTMWPMESNNWDGKLGWGTWRKMLKMYDYVSDEETYIIHQGRRVALENVGKEYKLITFDHPQGIDLHSHGDFSKGRKAHTINYLVLHWGSTSASRLAKVLAGRDISSHFGIDGDVIYQYIDTHHRAWHAGFVNSWSVGIDFCQQPTEKWCPKLQASGWDVEVIPNPTDRGDKRITTLNKKAEKAGKAFIKDLCTALGVPLQTPCGKDGLERKGAPFHGVMAASTLKDGSFKGVVGHHHVKKTKWDIAPWWSQLFENK